MKRFFILLFGLTLFLGCKEEYSFSKPEPLLDEETYMDIFYDLELLRASQSRGIKGLIIDSLYKEVFKKHETDTLLFTKSHEYYQSQIIQQQVRVDSLLARIEKELIPFYKLDSLKAQEDEIKE